MGSAIEIPTHHGCSAYSPCESPTCWPQRWTLSPEYNTTFHRDQLSHLTEHRRHWTKSIIENFMETNKLISKICMDDYRTMKPKLLLRKNKKEGCVLPDIKIKLTKIVWYQCRNKLSSETEDRAQKHTDIHGNWIYSRTDVKDLQGKGWTVTNDTDTTGYPYRKRLIPSSCPT